MATKDAKIDPKATTYGRPRLLTHEEILDAAIEMGLETLTMKRLATALGVGTATLYQYFDSRKALTRAAAVHALADVPLPEDTGQHWSEIAREYVRVVQALLAENPTFLQSYQHTDYGFEVQFRLIEGFLEAMTKRGFDTESAMEFFNVVGLSAFAGAIETVRQREFEFQDETMDGVARRQFDRLDGEQFPHFKAALHVFTRPPEAKINVLFEAALRTIARDRGEDENTVRGDK